MPPLTHLNSRGERAMGACLRRKPHASLSLFFCAVGFVFLAYMLTFFFFVVVVLAGNFSRILLFSLLGGIFHLKRQLLQALPKIMAYLWARLICPRPNRSDHKCFSQTHPTSLQTLSSSASQLSSFEFPAELQEADKPLWRVVQHIWNLSHSCKKLRALSISHSQATGLHASVVQVGRMSLQFCFWLPQSVTCVVPLGVSLTNYW